MSSATISRPDPGIPTLSPLLGRGYLLPFPILDRSPVPFHRATDADGDDTERICRCVSTSSTPKASPVAQRFLGCLPRDHAVAVEVDDVASGHAELVYDFRDGGEADGWLHALFRYEDRQSGHVAESSFGAHVFNTAMTYKDEPQSYIGPPPGLTHDVVPETRRRHAARLSPC